MLPECIELTRHFLTNLKIMPVIMMAGNHDLNINNKERLDGLTPIVNGIDKHLPLYYIKKTGIYKYHNIIWSLSSVQDYTIVDPNSFDITDFDDNDITYNKTYKICLFHGRINGALLFNKSKLEGEINNKTKKTITPASFNGYDYTLLGDIHKFQYMDNLPNHKIAYAGSLIQQNHGESLNNHGVLVWDLENKTSKLVEIKNNYGYISYTIDKTYVNEILETKLETYKKNKPHNIRLRLYYSDIGNNQLNEIGNIFKNYFNVLEINQIDISQNSSNIEKEISLNITDVNYQNKLIEKILIQNLI